ncbi:MAG: hypothetical protein JFR38_07175 [Muribaculaceae bacterium]|nr:hypothetical protein [Muribaculaceae bacterium]
MSEKEKNCADCQGGGCSGGCNGCTGCGAEPRGKLTCTDWLSDIPAGDCDLVEVLFKNTRKGIYRNSTHLDLAIGDMVAVEASPGHDIGCVTLTGPLVRLRLRRRSKNDGEIKRVFRKARPADLEKYREARAREHETMIRARRIAEKLGLNMKIGDVEFQGDGNKAIFYYIADERVDFRQLIKVLAENFKVRIEMKQIGARQEAGRIGGIGPCGRPLCCSSWMTNFVSVATGAARYQDISLNPQKLAGQCAKLKCCLNFEVDAYVEAVKSLPSREIRLETADATYFHFKTDIFRRRITYSTDKRLAVNLVTIDADRAFEVIALNKAGEKPLTLESEEQQAKPKEAAAYGDLLGQDDLTRFDKKKKKKRKGPKPVKEAREGAEQPQPQPRPKAPREGGEQKDAAQHKRRNRNRNRSRGPQGEGGGAPKND